MIQLTYLTGPVSFDNRALKSVLGEWFWLNRDTAPVPEHHRTVPDIMSVVSGTGMIFVIRGVFVFDLPLAIFGIALVCCGKLWFPDQMAWLWEDMKDANE